MSDSTIIAAPRQLQSAGLDVVLVLIAGAGEQTARRLIEFFTTTKILNKNTRRNYVERNVKACSSAKGFLRSWRAPFRPPVGGAGIAV
jgi:hypothetical protein